MPGGRPKSDAKKRFLNMVTVASNGCHEWGSTIHRDGYGKCYYEGKQMQAHRVSYLLFVGKITDGLHVLHCCDNRKCVNPEHLYLGTPKQNVADKISRYQGLWGRMKYSGQQIEEARKLYAQGMTQQAIADKLGMDQTTVSRFVRGDFLKRN